MQIVRKKLSADELSTPGLRYNSETDAVESLINNEWVDTPDADPRSNPALLYPALTTSDPRCDAAANMVAAIKNIVDQAVAVSTIVEMASLLYALFVVIFPPLLIFSPLVWALADIIFNLTVVVVDAAFTSSVYDDLLCYFYDNEADDGRLDGDGLEAVRQAVTDNQDAAVAAVIDGIFLIMGFVGMDNVGASGAETGECAACAPCFEYDFTIDGQGWTAVSPTTYETDVGFIGQYVDEGSATWAFAYIDIAPQRLFSVKIDYCIDAGSGINNSVAWYAYLDGELVDYGADVPTVGCPEEFGSLVTYTGNVDRVYINVNSGADGSAGVIIIAAEICPYG